VPSRIAVEISFYVAQRFVSKSNAIAAGEMNGLRAMQVYRATEDLHYLKTSALLQILFALGVAAFLNDKRVVLIVHLTDAL
jgi:hypothetical protein